MDIVQQVQAAIQSFTAGGTDQTPTERLTYALGWIVANSIVAARYCDSAIDALPIYHPEHGWDRLLFTRRVSCLQCADEPADSFGMLMLDGEDPPRLTHPNGETRIALGSLLRSNPESALTQVRSFFPPIGLVDGDHTACWHTRAASYPVLYAVVTDLIARYPTITAAREVFIDDAQIDGAYHPLYIHTATRSTRHVYDWFELQSPDFHAYSRIHGEQAIFLTNAGWWSSVLKPLSAEQPENIARRILGWLRVCGEPDSEVD
jgi:hypothetical protein